MPGPPPGANVNGVGIPADTTFDERTRIMAVRTTSRAVAATVFATGLLAAGAPAASAIDTSSLAPPPADCAIDAEAIADETPHPIEGVEWAVGEQGNVCGNLGYLFLETEGGTAGSPTQVVLFHRGEQTATQPAGDSRVLLGGESDFHVELRVQQEPEEGDANAEATYASTFYVWNPFAADATAVPLPAGFPS